MCCFLLKPRPFPGWGERGSRHSRNIFSVPSLVLRQPHLRAEKRGSLELQRGDGRWRRHVCSNSSQPNVLCHPSDFLQAEVSLCSLPSFSPVSDAMGSSPQFLHEIHISYCILNPWDTLGIFQFPFYIWQLIFTSKSKPTQMSPDNKTSQRSKTFHPCFSQSEAQ